jgi:hypothetical protein
MGTLVYAATYCGAVFSTRHFLAMVAITIPWETQSREHNINSQGLTPKTPLPCQGVDNRLDVQGDSVDCHSWKGRYEEEVQIRRG